jgi:hypothetical protein
MAVWYILWSFWCLFPRFGMLYQNNLATLVFGRHFFSNRIQIIQILRLTGLAAISSEFFLKTNLSRSELWPEMESFGWL